MLILTLYLKSQVNTRSLQLLPNLERDHSLLEGSSVSSSSSPWLPFHLLLLQHALHWSAPLCLHLPVFCLVVFPCVTPPSIFVCLHCPACPVAPINPKTHLGSPWSSQKPRRRKPLPHPPSAWQHPPIQALCPLSKGRAPDPARPLRPPTHLRTTTTMRTMRQRTRRGPRGVPSLPQWSPATRGTASRRRPTQQAQTLPAATGARHAPPARGAQGARNALRPGLPNRRLPTKVSSSAEQHTRPAGSKCKDLSLSNNTIRLPQVIFYIPDDFVFFAGQHAGSCRFICCFFMLLTCSFHEKFVFPLT